MITVRALAGHAEYQRAVELQKIIWRFEELEVLPVRLFVTAVKVGGQALGAFDGERMIGFCLAIPGVKHTDPGSRSYLHSHMLGVLEDYRNSGVGKMLKLAQRQDALQRGVDLIEWTFDPFESKNAFFNIERLGAVVRRYVQNMYGTTTSPLHGGLPTDRCVAEWCIASPRVVDTLREGRSRVETEAIIDVPPERTAATQTRLREQFLYCFDKGLAVTGFDRSGNGAYLLTSWPSN
jgi:predicted GNAT superfamily acetyltransferase